MRGVTTKRLKSYANFLKAENEEKYKDLPARKIYQRLKKVWNSDKDFQKFIGKAFNKAN